MIYDLPSDIAKEPQSKSRALDGGEVEGASDSVTAESDKDATNQMIKVLAIASASARSNGNGSRQPLVESQLGFTTPRLTREQDRSGSGKANSDRREAAPPVFEAHQASEQRVEGEALEDLLW